MECIASRDNEKIKRAGRIATSAAYRTEQGLFFAEGRRLCFDLAQTLPPKTAFVTEKFLKNHPEAAGLAPTVYQISEPVDDKLSQTQTPQGVYCLFERPSTTLAELDSTRGILLCEEMQNPANVGGILRTAAAFGFGGVVLAGGADPYSPKALRASMGGVGRLPVVGGSTLAEAAAFLRQKGVTLYAAALEGAELLPAVQPQKPFALLVGNEGAGLSPAALALASYRVYIPMCNGVESLNAAVAASVLMYYFKQNSEG